MMTYLMLICLNLLIHNSVGENGYQGVLRAPLREDMPPSWSNEIKTMLTDALGMEINKLKENIEKRFEQIFVSKLEEKLEENLGKKLEKTLEEELRIKLEGKLEDKLRNKLETKIEENLKNKFDDQFEKKHNKTQTVEWVETTLKDAILLSGRAVVAGYEPDGSLLYIFKDSIENNNIVTGKLNANKHSGRLASVDSSFYYHIIKDDGTAKVLCAPPEKVKWVECSDGAAVPPNAVVGGQYNGEMVYVGRAREQGSLIPGWVRPSSKALYLVFGDNSSTHNTYEVLCLV